MGLALDYHSDDIIPGLGECRRLGPDPDRTKRFPRSAHYLFNGALGPAQTLPTLWDIGTLPAYKRPLFDLPRREDPNLRVDRERRRHRTRSRWSAETVEGRDLARSDVPLPVADRSNRRTPSLERQEAFRDESTSKRNSLQRETSFKARNVSGDETTAELYRLGLLYDDEHLRGEGFNFAVLDREEPAYTLRPAKRPRKLNRARGYDAFEAYTFRGRRDLPDHGLPLTLDLSFAELARDDAIARFLISPDPSETSSEDEAIQHGLEERTSDEGRQASTDDADFGNAPLGASCELGSLHSLRNVPEDEVDTASGDQNNDCNDENIALNLTPDGDPNPDPFDNDDVVSECSCSCDNDPDYELLDGEEPEVERLEGSAQQAGEGAETWVMLG